MDIQETINKLIEYAPRIIEALGVVLIGYWAYKMKSKLKEVGEKQDAADTERQQIAKNVNKSVEQNEEIVAKVEAVHRIVG